jgi:hypothetical protein
MKPLPQWIVNVTDIIANMIIVYVAITSGLSPLTLGLLVLCFATTIWRWKIGR